MFGKGQTFETFLEIFTIQWLREHLGAGDGDEGGEEGEGLPPLEGLPRGTGLKYFHRQIFSWEGKKHFQGQRRIGLTS